ncbi:MAG: hypothetical protein JWM89_3308 [Acidimicrobiales bacterium]|nr:hypothetical protein [Acidimicrobiales bacterium]
MPRRYLREHAGPYLAAIPKPLAAVEDLGISDDIAALAEEASVEIARFDAELGSELAPFSALLLRSESAASSRIEQLTASAKAIALAELGDPSKHNANLIVANTRSMEAAIRLADHLDEQAIIDMQEALLGQRHPEWTGHWRNEQVWIKGNNYGPHGADFVPPHHERVPAAMADLVKFLRRDDLPALAQTAVAHAQFETIHPFPDGNGRTGRSLVHAVLRSKRLTRNVTVPVSAGLLTDTDAYFEALTAYRAGRPAEIVEQMANASFLAVANGRRLVSDLEAIRASWDERVRSRRGATAWRVADRLVRQPVVDSPTLQRELGVSAPSANGAIEVLVEAGVLAKVSGNHRNRKWAATEVLDALDHFAQRAGRRVKGT